MIAENPIILGAVVIGLVWLIRKFAWDAEGLKALWLTYVVSVFIAFIEIMATGGFELEVCSPVADPVEAVQCALAIIQGLTAQAGILFVTAKLIYEALRIEIAGRTLLGDKL